MLQRPRRAVRARLDSRGESQPCRVSARAIIYLGFRGCRLQFALSELSLRIPTEVNTSSLR